MIHSKGEKCTHTLKKKKVVLFCFNLGKDVLLELRQREPEILELELQVL